MICQVCRERYAPCEPGSDDRDGMSICAECRRALDEAAECDLAEARRRREARQARDEREVARIARQERWAQAKAIMAR